MPNQTGTPKPTIEQHLKACGVSRRSFLQLCSAIMVTAPMGMALTEGPASCKSPRRSGRPGGHRSSGCIFRIAPAAPRRCCALRRPDVADLILNVISLDYHETLMAASGRTGRSRAASARWKRTPESTCWWWKARFRRSTTASTCNWAAVRPSRCFERWHPSLRP